MMTWIGRRCSVNQQLAPCSTEMGRKATYLVLVTCAVALRTVDQNQKKQLVKQLEQDCEGLMRRAPKAPGVQAPTVTHKMSRTR